MYGLPPGVAASNLIEVPSTAPMASTPSYLELYTAAGVAASTLIEQPLHHNRWPPTTGTTNYLLYFFFLF